MKTIEEKAILICDSQYGVYIPQIVIDEFINEEEFDWSDVSEESVETLLNTPRYTNNRDYEESYWEAWEDVLNNVKIEIDGIPYHMIQNQDVFLIPDECMDELEEWII